MPANAFGPRPAFAAARHRSPGGQAELQLQYYRAVLDQFDTFVDGLVVDQTHNPGGSVAYCTSSTRASLIGVAYDAGKGIREPIPFFDEHLLPDESSTPEVKAAAERAVMHLPPLRLHRDPPRHPTSARSSAATWGSAASIAHGARGIRASIWSCWRAGQRGPPDPITPMTG